MSAASRIIEGTLTYDESLITIEAYAIQGVQTSTSPIQVLADNIAGYIVSVIVDFSCFTIIYWIIIDYTHFNHIEKDSMYHHSMMGHSQQKKLSRIESVFELVFRFTDTILSIVCSRTLGFATSTIVMVNTIIGMIARPKRIKFRESLTIFALQSMDFSLLLVTDDNVTTVHDTATQV
ncbi:unnamed protein product, partial [Rotaria sp. Silwood1]